MARRAHLYPSRTQKLSAAAATIVRKCDNSALPGRQRTGRSFFFLHKIGIKEKLAILIILIM
jgi:hypothetical protein